MITHTGSVGPFAVSITQSEPTTPALPTPVVGATVQAVDFPRLTGVLQGTRFCRTFSSPGDGILPWTHGRRRLPVGVAEFHSWKDWPDDDTAIAAVNHLLDTMPRALLDDPPLLPELDITDPDGYSDGHTDGFSLLLSYAHEGEPDFLAAGRPVREWRRRHRVAYRTIRQHPHGARVGYMPIQTQNWTEASSTATRTKGDFDPVAWWAGVGDYAAMDCYLISITDRPASAALYKDPARFLELPLQLAHATGRRLFLPELGVIRQGNPADTGSLRAAWIRAVVDHLQFVGCAAVAWWDAPGANQRDFRLADGPSLAAWQEAIALQ